MVKIAIIIASFMVTLFARFIIMIFTTVIILKEIIVMLMATAIKAMYL